MTETKNQSEYFVQVMNDFINDSFEDGELGRIKLFLYSFLKTHQGFFPECMFNMKYLMEIVGSQASSHLFATKLYRDVIAALNWFVDNEYIMAPEKPFDEYKKDELIIVRYLENGFTIGGQTYAGKNKLEESFTKLTEYEYNAIKGTKNAPLDLQVFLFIKMKIFPRAEYMSIEDRAESYHLSYDDITEACGISKPATIRSIKRLKEFKLIASEKPANFEKFARVAGLKAAIGTSTYSNLKTVYVLYKPGWEEELKYGVKQYVEQAKELFKYKGDDN